MKINLKIIEQTTKEKPKNKLWNKKMDDQCKSFIHSLLKDVSIIYLICKKVSFLFQQKTFQIYPRIIKRRKEINRSIDRSSNIKSKMYVLHCSRQNIEKKKYFLKKRPIFSWSWSLPMNLTIYSPRLSQNLWNL